MTKTSKFWLYFGVMLVCTGFGTAVGAVIIFLYFWDDIKKTILQSRDTQSHTSMHYDDNVLDEMK